ncbi:MAG: RelA/SpoT family protein, partial [Caldilineaceae bacterium]
TEPAAEPAPHGLPQGRPATEEPSRAPVTSGAFLTQQGSTGAQSTPAAEHDTNAGGALLAKAPPPRAPRAAEADETPTAGDDAPSSSEIVEQLGHVLAGDNRANPVAGAYLPAADDDATPPTTAQAPQLPRTFEPLFVTIRAVTPLPPAQPPTAGGQPVRIAPDAEEVSAIERLLHSLATHFRREDYLLVVRAYMLASYAHRNQQRESGEPYILHPIAVSQILFELGMDPECVAAGMLHDVAEDTDFTIEYISGQFGAEIAALVDGVTKLKRINEMGSARAGTANHKAESLRKMFIAMVDDVRVVLIKLADRLHNMRTLGSQKEHKRRRIARETLEIFAPLANRLGIWPVKSELEDLSFRYLEPATYKELMKAVLQKQPERERMLIMTKTELERELARQGIIAEVSARPKHIYSIYRKMQRKAVGFDQIYDVLALRVLVENEGQCYATLGIVHSTWRPIPGEFDDYIANPKNNMYRSLHTSVLSHRSGRPMEIQIRTGDMHREAELGIAAHWQYKEQQNSTDQYMNNKINVMRHWMRQVMEWRNDVTDAEEFIDGMKTDMFNEHVFVFTPRGDIIDLPKGSTPIDFAYAIHTELGHRCRGASVNGKLVPLDYKLQNSDQVEVISAKRGGPSRDWLNPSLEYVATQRARSKIRGWLRKQNRDENVQRGRQTLERELRRLSSTISFDDLSKLFNIDKVDDFLAAIGFGDINSQHIAQKLLEQEARERNRLQAQQGLWPGNLPTPGERSERSDRATVGDGLSIQGVGGVLNNLGKCCNPVPGDPIVGYVTRGRGITIHRVNCPNMASALRKGSDARLMTDVAWTSKPEKTYPVKIQVSAYDRQGLVRDIAGLVADEQINMRSVEALTGQKNNLAIVTATLEIEDATQLMRILTKMDRLSNVVEARRLLG